MNGPYNGLFVLDLSRVLAGPFAAMMLGDLGARVVKVEVPVRGDDSRSYGPFLDGRSLYFARVNRGKQSIALNLRDDVDRAVLLAMADAADVLIENFRPGVMERLGLSAAVLRERNPRLVYTSISGFGQTGPWRSRPAYDAVVQGMSGLMDITGTAGGHPTKPGSPVADLAAGLYAFGAVGSALWARERTGEGVHLDIAMLDATVSFLEGAALSYLATGVSPPRMGNAHYSIAPFDTFRCADRDISICAANDALFGVLCATLGVPTLVTDPRFADNAGRHAAREALKDAVEAALSVASAEHWLDVLGSAGVPCGPIATVAEAVTSEQVVARQMVVTAGGLPLLGNPIKAVGWPDPPERPAAPVLDADGPTLREEFTDSGPVSA